MFQDRGCHINLCSDCKITRVKSVKPCAEVAQTLRRSMPGKRLVLRLHPADKVGLGAKLPEGVELDTSQKRPLRFNDVYCVVTMSSTVGVHAVLNGIPTVAVDQTSMTRVPPYNVSAAHLDAVGPLHSCCITS